MFNDSVLTFIIHFITKPMGVDYHECGQCGKVGHDAGDYAHCHSCEDFICHRCIDACRCYLKNNEEVYACKTCYDDDITTSEKSIMLDFLLQNSKYKDIESLRTDLREKGMLSKPKFIFFSCEQYDDDNEQTSVCDTSENNINPSKRPFEYDNNDDNQLKCAKETITSTLNHKMNDKL